MTDQNPAAQPAAKITSTSRIFLAGSWMLAICLVLVAVFLGIRVLNTQAAPAEETAQPALALPALAEAETNDDTGSANMPIINLSSVTDSITRRSTMHTNIPTRPRQGLHPDRSLSMLCVAVRPVYRLRYAPGCAFPVIPPAR